MTAGANVAARRGPSKTLILASTAGALLFAGALIATPFVVGPLVRDRITAEAKARGVEMVFRDVSFFWWSVSLEGIRFRLIGVPGIEGTLKNLDVTLSSWEPKRITATDLRVEAVGSVADLALALGEWTRAHPKAYEVPVTATHVAVSYRGAPNEAPWLTIDDGAFAEGAAGTVRFAAANARVSSVDVGAVSAAWTTSAAAIAMAFGAETPEAGPLKFVVRYAAAPPTATVTLAPTPLEKLSGPLAVPLLAPGAVASGTVDLTFASGLESGPVTGTVTSKLDGWIPPHPVELDGFLFGKTTTFTSLLDVSADRKLVKLSDSRVKAGAFALNGGGTIERREGYGVIRMAMSGYLPCAAVAQSAASAHIGSLFSRILGQAARKVVDGSVAVNVSLTADSRNLDGAKVVPTIGVGCGLVPLFGLDAKRLQELPEKLRALASALPLPDVSLDLPGVTAGAPGGGTAGRPGLPSMPTSLPSLASALPSLPALPTSLPSLPTSLPSLPSGFALPAPAPAPSQ